MPSTHHPLPTWLIKHPKILPAIYLLQRWGLMRNWIIGPVFKHWITRQLESMTASDSTLTILDIGCGEGLYLYKASRIIGPTNKHFKLYGVDKNKEWIHFLSNHSLFNADFRVMDVNVETQPLLLQIGHSQQVICTSTLQYAHRPLEVLQSWFDAMLPGAEFFVYFPIDHHQYTPWYKSLFNQGQNYESNFNRTSPLGLTAFNQFKDSNTNVQTLNCQMCFHALAAIGHEQFSTAQMLSRWTLKNKKFQGFSVAIRTVGWVLMVPTWIIGMLLFCIDGYLPLGKPNSVLWVVKKS